MARTSKYDALQWIVEVYNGRFYEQIAAFNLDEAAIDYAKRCYKNGAGWPGYRVIERTGCDKWAEVFKIGLPS